MNIRNFRDFSVCFRNPTEFIAQWYSLIERLRAILIWFFFFWASDDCDVWTRYGIRIVGVEFQCYQYHKAYRCTCGSLLTREEVKRKKKVAKSMKLEEFNFCMCDECLKRYSDF